MKARIKAAKPKRTLKVRKNGKHAVDAASTLSVPMTTMRQVLRNQAFRGWMMPGVASYTPIMVEGILRGALAGNYFQQWELFRLMLDTWPVLAACKEELLYGVTRRELQYDPYTAEDEEPSENAIEREKLITAALRNMKPVAEADENGVEGTISDIMDAWFRGISVLEVLWDTTEIEGEGLVTVPRATKFGDPSCYAWGEDGKLGLVDDSSTSDISRGYRTNPVRPFPPYKFLTAIHKAQSGSPIGGALLRPLAWWWCAANFSSDWLLNLAQLFGLPFRWASYDAAAPAETVNAVCNMLQNMGSAGWAAFPEGTTLELKEATRGSDRTPQGDLLDRADAYARLLILGQTMTGNTIASGRGGQSFGTVEAQLKQDRLDAASFFVSNVFNRQLIPYILTLNYGDAMEAPRCRFLKETEGTYQDAQRDQILAGLGLPIPFSYLRHKYGVADAINDEAVTEPPPKPVAPSSVTPGPKGTRPLSEPSRNGSPSPKEVQTKLEEISTIEDDALFAIKLEQLAEVLEPPPVPPSAPARTPRVGKNWHSRPFITKNAAEHFAKEHPGTWVEEAVTNGKPNGWSVKFEA
jgi:phage gp29-like protein